MKQKVVSKAIIRQNNQVLLLRRQGGRPSIRGLYELPGGKVNKREQPEDALVSGLKVHIGVKPTSYQLIDVIAFIDPDDRELQYIFIIFSATVGPKASLSLSSEYDKYIWKELSNIQAESITESTKQILGLRNFPITVPVKTTGLDNTVDKKTTKAIGYCDGGSRGNPGPSAAGFIFINKDQRAIAEGGKYLGVTSNPVAEYSALQLALEEALRIGIKELYMRLDSQVLVDQLNSTGSAAKPSKETGVIYKKIKTLSKKFSKITFSHVRREQNTLADGIVNKILDQAQKDVL